MGEMDGVLERLLRANEKQAEGTGALVELQRATGERLRTIEDHNRQQTQLLGAMVGQIERMEEAREAATNDVKVHVDAAVKSGLATSEAWWRKAVFISTAVVGGASLLAPALTRLLEALLK